MAKHAARSNEPLTETPFARFTRNMRALMAVPKKELDEKIEQARRVRQGARRARAKG